MKKTCKHCGSPFQTQNEAEVFCCSGCEYVYHLINDEGLNRFYDLKNESIAPVKSSVFQDIDYSWLEDTVSEAESSGSGAIRITLDLQGISCIGCVWLLEKVFLRLPGALRIDINAQYGQIQLTWSKGTCDIVDFARQVSKYGYRLGPAGKEREKESGRLGSRIGICAALAMNTMLFSLPFYLGMETSFRFAGMFRLLTAIFATLSVGIGGIYFMDRGLKALMHRSLHIDLPIALGIILAYLGSITGWFFRMETMIYFDFVSIFIFLMLTGRWLQEIAVEKNRNQLIKIDVRPKTVVTFANPGNRETPVFSGEKETVVADLKEGELYGIRPGQTNPIDAELLDTDASISLEWINGEADIRHWKIGRILPSGATNVGLQTIHLKARERWENSLLARLTRNSRLESQRNPGLERILKYYLILVLLLAFMGGAGWYIATRQFILAAQVLISILVVSCPCALGVAYPLANELAVVSLRKIGLFIKNASIWSQLANLKKIVFDKTGTLTLEVPELQNPEAITALDIRARSILWSMVETSLHPVSRCLRENLLVLSRREGQSFNRAKIQYSALEEKVGYGMACKTGEEEWTLGRPGWKDSGKLQESDDSAVVDSAYSADTVFAVNGQKVASFVFRDAVRSDAREEIKALGERNLDIYILSGDRESKVTEILRDLDLPESRGFSDMSPEDKAAWLHSRDATDTLFIGDGANDSLAFDHAACRGTPVIDRGFLEEKADFYFLGRRLNCIRLLIETSAIRKKALWRVTFFAIIYNISAIGVCLAGKMNPLIAAIIMPISSLLTIAMVIGTYRNLNVDHR